MVEKIVSLIGKSVAWLTLAMVLLTFVTVVLRYGFSLGWIWVQESVNYMHAMVFMLAAAWTLQLDGHVRVDIFYRDRSARHQALVDLSGTLIFLIPVCVFLIVTAWEYVLSSWMLLEKSREAGGLPLVFVLKSLIILLPVLLLAQATSGMIKSYSVLRQHRESESPV